MSLRDEEIIPGVVAYFDHRQLLAEPDIDRNEDGLDRDGPFLCVQVKDGKSVWLGLTTQFRKERLIISPLWRLDGSPLWQEEDMFVTDGLNTFVGPNSAFIRCTSSEVHFTLHARPRVTPEGVAAAVDEAKAQGAPLLET